MKNAHFKTELLIVPLEKMKVIALFAFIAFVKKTMFVTSQGISTASMRMLKTPLEERNVENKSDICDFISSIVPHK